MPTRHGPTLRRLRGERGLTQAAAARAMHISLSYYNQLENDRRPLTVPLRLRAAEVFGVDPTVLSDDREARLVADLREALTPEAGGLDATTVVDDDLQDLAAASPRLAQAVLATHRRHRDEVERLRAVAGQLGDGGRALPPAAPMPFEEVRDVFYARRNYLDDLDRAAEDVNGLLGVQPRDGGAAIADHLADTYDVEVVTAPTGDGDAPKRRFDASRGVLELGAHLSAGQRAFQLATQLAFLAFGRHLDAIVTDAGVSSDEARTLLRIGVASYAAGAIVLPYETFRAAAEELRYDVERLGLRFGFGYETICHRLSTLQRADAPGVPFFFVRVDRAGNVSKRQSATDFHFSRVGGTCPLWNVYEAFERPGKVLTQLAEMPDGRTYLWIARTVTSGGRGYGAPTKTFAIGLGCDVAHAHRLVYAEGLALDRPGAATPIGAGCRVCERVGCPQRAFPPIGRELAVDPDVSHDEPYPVA